MTSPSILVEPVPAAALVAGLTSYLIAPDTIPCPECGGRCAIPLNEVDDWDPCQRCNAEGTVPFRPVAGDRLHVRVSDTLPADGTRYGTRYGDWRVESWHRMSDGEPEAWLCRPNVTGIGPLRPGSGLTATITAALPIVGNESDYGGDCIHVDDTTGFATLCEQYDAGLWDFTKLHGVTVFQPGLWVPGATVLHLTDIKETP